MGHKSPVLTQSGHSSGYPFQQEGAENKYSLSRNRHRVGGAFGDKGNADEDCRT